MARKQSAATVGAVAADGGALTSAPNLQPHCNPGAVARQDPPHEQNVIEIIKSAIDFPSLVEETVGSLPRRPDGRPVLIRCLWHDDRKPSLAIYHDHAHCYGCGWHGDVYDWVMELRGVGFRTALELLAHRAGISLHPIPEKTARAIQGRRAFEGALARAMRHFSTTLWRTPKALAYARDRWPDEAIRSEQLGYANGQALPPLDHPLARQVVERLNRRAREVGGMIIYPHREAGSIIYLTGRSIKGKAHYNPPRDLAGPKRPYLNAAYSVDAKKIVVVEGQACAISLSGWTVPAIALAGSGLTGNLVERLAQHVARGAIVYVVPDGDGRTDLEGLAEVVGPLLRIVQLPDDMEDVNQYAQDGATAERFRALLGKAYTWLDQLIEHAADAQGAARDQQIEALFPLLVELPPVTLARYKGRVVRALKEIGARDFNRLLKATAEVEEEETPPTLEVIEEDYALLSPALDFMEDLGVVTVPFLAKRGDELVSQPFLITSERQMLPLREERLIDLGERTILLEDLPTVLGSRPRWRYPDVQAYLNGDNPSPVEAYIVTARILDKYIDFRNEFTSNIVALWVQGTYFYPLFEAFPYIALQGPKSSGKTKVLELMANLAFNARVSSNISPSSLFRVVEATRGTLGIDEAEALANAWSPASTELRLLLNAGYKQGSPAIRCVGDNHQVVEFRVYAPKMLASIRGVEDVLESRCIHVAMLRTRGEKGERGISVEGEDWAGIRHRLYCTTLQHFPGVRAAYRRGAGADGLRNRHAELWRPLLAIASYLDGQGASGLLSLAREYALQDAKHRSGTSLDDVRIAVLMALHKLVVLEGKSEVMPGEVRDAMADFLEEQRHADVTAQFVGYRLKEFGLKKRTGRSRGSVYPVEKDTVLDVMFRYDVSPPGVAEEDEDQIDV